MKANPPIKLGLFRRARVLTLLALGGLLLPLLSPWASSWPSTVHWVHDLAVHWQTVYAALLIVGTLLWAYATYSFLPLLMLPLVAAFPMLTAVQASGRQAAEAKSSLTVVTFNVHLDNDRVREVLDWLHQTSADVVVLQEVNPAFAKALTNDPRFEHRVLAPREDPFGMALLSRLPLEGVKVRTAKASALPAIEAQVVHQGVRVPLVALHPMPPIAPQYVAQRDASLHEEAKALEGSAGMLVGDFNATVWSSAFVQLRALGWVSASPSMGTWPAPAPSPTRIGLDHVLVNKTWSIRSSELGPVLGSDHLPVVVKLELRDK